MRHQFDARLVLTILDALSIISLSVSVACGQGPPPAGNAQPRVATTPGAATDDSLAAGFVQRFYNWYAPVALEERKVPAWWHVLDSATSFLDPALTAALRGDSIAREQTIDTREMLDF